METQRYLHLCDFSAITLRFKIPTAIPCNGRSMQLHAHVLNHLYFRINCDRFTTPPPRNNPYPLQFWKHSHAARASCCADRTDLLLAWDRFPNGGSLKLAGSGYPNFGFRSRSNGILFDTKHFGTTTALRHLQCPSFK